MLLNDKINLLNEQLSFLLTKNRELKAAQQNYFDSILPIIEAKLKNTENNAKTTADLKEIQEILEKDKTLSMEEFDEDLSFLQEQIEALNQVKTVEDPKRAEAILNMMFEAALELPENAKFQEKITEDFELAKANLPGSGKMKLIDGRTGEFFHEDVVVGHTYILKLIHMEYM